MQNILTFDDIEEIEIDLTGTCNLQCPLCTRNYKHAKHMLIQNNRNLADIILQLNKFKNLKRIFLAGAISEPTLYPNFIEFIKYLNSKNIYYELFTNGNTHDEKWWKELGKIIAKNCIVCFTICGSTQELHEKYRVGSSLQQILNNAAAFKNNNKNDYCQFIRFEYNKDDLYTSNINLIFKKFSHYFIVDSEGQRRLNDKNKNFNTNEIMPIKKRNSIISYIFQMSNKKFKNGNKIICKSYNEKKLYINQFGKISTCYIHAEFENDYLDENTKIINYNKILNYKYKDCYLCTQFVLNIIKKFNMEFIC